MIPRLLRTAVLPRREAEPLELHLEPFQAERRKRARQVQVNTVVIPSLRLVGFALLAAGVLIHNHLILGELSWGAWLWVTAILAAYCAGSWYLLHILYADLLPRFDLGVFLLGCDMGVLSLVIYATGAERSWLFFLPIFRVIDQTTTSFPRTLAFAHLAPLAYLVVPLYGALIEGRAIPPGPEAAKVLFIYAGSIYIAFVARTADERHQRVTEAVRLARGLIQELGAKSQALEASAGELQAALDAQGKLAQENATLYETTRRERTRQAQILDSTSEGIVFVSPDGRIELANARAGELLGFEPTAVAGMEMARLVSRLYAVGDGDSFVATLQALLHDPWMGGSGDLQQPATGRVFHWSARPARDSEGGSPGLTFTLQDVTGARDLVQQLEDKSRLLEDARARAEEASRAKGEFLANMTHEIRTPLSAIIGTVQQMLEARADDVQLRRVQASAEGLMALIGDILDFSKIESRKLTLDEGPLLLRETLADAVQLVEIRALDKGLTLRMDVSDAIPDAIVGDAMRLRQILINLLGNAIKFTEVGEVRLRVGVAHLLPGEVCLHFSVEDTGIGIPRDKQELVFEAFAQADGSTARRYGGTGLGLSISARLVELMGGDMWVESEPGRGAAFRFTAIFALQGAGGQRPPDGEATEVGRREPWTVLVVEDEAIHRELLSALLLGRGHRVVTARNGREALTELSRNRVDIALMDLQMPELDGFDTTSTIREWEGRRGGHLPIVAMTASVMADDPERCTAIGVDRFLTKPIRRETLFRVVEELARTAEPREVPPELAGRPTFLAGLGGDRALARKLVEIFLEQSPGLVENVRVAIEAGDGDGLRRAAHALRGMVSNFPPGPARGAAARMETIGFDNDLAAAHDVFPVLEQEIARLRDLLPSLV
jgi:PAS domain S-box-containing protein